MKSRMRFSMRFVGKSRYEYLFLGLVLSLCSSVNADSVSSPLWQTALTTKFETQARKTNDTNEPSSYYSNHSLGNTQIENAQMMTLNENLMRDLLNLDSSGIEKPKQSVDDFEIGTRSIDAKDKYTISLPLVDGSIIDLELVKDIVLPALLAAKYPDIHTYKVLANDYVFAGKIDISSNGFHAMLHLHDGDIVFIDPTEPSKSSKNEYAIYNKNAQKSDGNRQHSCGVSNNQLARNGFYAGKRFDENNLLSSPIISAREVNLTNETLSNVIGARTEDSLKNYTIAIATTGEYSAKFGGSVGGTMAAITTTINRVNQILERDLGIHLNLVENNDLLINTDPGADPYTETALIDLVFQNQDFIDATIGNRNYDLGHLFTASGGGLAAIASVCNSGDKAKAASGITSPRGDGFDLDFVAHEIGHQLGATHTFNSTQGSCSAQTRTARSAFEPGSGSSIMSYAGTCGLDNIQSGTDGMYHIGSIKQIGEYTNNGVGSRCGVFNSSLNSPPEPNAGENFVIPSRTPFELMGDASDEDGDSLIYAWEQLDAGDASTENLDRGNNAIFRVHTPNSSKTRSFPPLENILSKQIARGETLPNHERDLTMSFVAQDGFNAAVSDEMLVKVVRTGSRFALNYPRASYTRGSTYPIFWNVANTDQSPINCSSVDVWLSLDGGQNFQVPMARNVPNIGETSVTIPADVSTSTQGRFKLKCSDNIFFSVSNRNFFVTVSDDSVNIEYNDEDLPDTNLEDLPLNIAAVVATSTEINTSSNSGGGGGVFDYLIGLFLLIFLRQQYFICNQKMS